MNKRIWFAAWAALCIAAILVICQPIGLQAQLSFGFFAVGCMLVIHLFKIGGIARHIFMVLMCAIALRYLYWRITSTLPPLDDLWSFIPGITLLLAEIYSILVLLVSFVISTDPYQRQHVPLRGDPDDYPTVDVLIPSYNEDDDILGTTLAAACNLEYPADKLNIYLLDDGGTDEKCRQQDATQRKAAIDRRARLQALCAEIGAHYIARRQNIGAKAGNLNAGLKKSNGEYVVVLDADHAPMRQFLKRTIGHLVEDRNLFLVQTPHVFLNPDPVEKNLNTYDVMPSENEMFYGVMQKGLDKWDSSFFCGSGAVLRRSALNEVDGFSGESITEDCETALELHAKGWSSAYVHEPLIVGFQPETFGSFITQRSRWCQGMVQLFLLKSPIFKPGLKMMQRLGYLSSMLFWLFPIPRLIFMFTPLLFIFFNLEIFDVTFMEFFAYIGLTMVAAAIAQNYVYGSVRWPWISEAYEYVQSVHLLPVIVSTFLRPRAPTFKVTDKGRSLEDEYYSPKGLVFIPLFFLLLAGAFTAGYRLYQSDFTNEMLLVVGIWSVFNLVLGALAVGVSAEKKELRRHYRIEPGVSGVPCAVEFGDTVFSGKIRNCSIGGVKVDVMIGDLEAEISAGGRARLAIYHPDTGSEVHRFNVIHCWDGIKDNRIRMGFALDRPSAIDRRAMAMLMFANNQVVLEKISGRQNGKSVVMGTLAIASWSFRYCLRGMVLVLRSLTHSTQKTSA